ncbi:MAG: hypothetical protein HKN47_23400 [Pirellulaceae bacterium]|nr:hypothetical protein [Pirellulaceae bacterium]
MQHLDLLGASEILGGWDRWYQIAGVDLQWQVLRAIADHLVTDPRTGACKIYRRVMVPDNGQIEEKIDCSMSDEWWGHDIGHNRGFINRYNASKRIERHDWHSF